jgi:hypothetical protein
MKSNILVPKRTMALPRRFTTDNAMTFDSMSRQRVIDAAGTHAGVMLGNTFRTHDGRTVDSTGSFLVGELERLDQTMNMPLSSVTYGRDIDLREDVTLADEVSSFTLSTFAAAGSMNQGIRNGKSWVGKSSDQIPGVGVDIGKTPLPLTPWALEIKFSILELESAAKLGRPIDAQKYEALQLKHQMDCDEQAYVGDSIINVPGLVNHTGVTNVSNVPNGAAASPLWSSKTPDEMLADVNAVITSTWAASGWAVMPNRILMPPAQFGFISTKTISSAGNVSILKYLLENNVLVASGKGRLEILPLKWCIGSGSGGTIGTTGTVDRLVCYTKEKRFVRFPMTMLSKTPIQYDSLYHKTTYYGRLGAVELVYPETIGYRDGL